MASIENMSTHQVVLLQAEHLFGRNVYACNTYINNPDVSRSHAAIHWCNGVWKLQDFSRNGTLVNGKFIRKLSVQLEVGSEIQFGSTQADTWKITDISSPSSYLKSLNSENRTLILENCHALPDDLKPEVVFYRDEEHTWVAETAEKKSPLLKGSRFIFNNEEWEFIENEVLQETIDYGHAIQNACFKFCVDLTEEDIRVKLMIDHNEHDLGKRSFNYIMLTLARKRLADQNLGYAAEEQGWMAIEDLEKDVSKEQGHEVDVYYLNLQIFRMRKQLSELKPIGHFFTNVIERRLGELRFAFPRLKIIKDNQCIGEMNNN
jgi:hypothetical protein